MLISQDRSAAALAARQVRWDCEPEISNRGKSMVRSDDDERARSDKHQMDRYLKVPVGLAGERACPRSVENEIRRAQFQSRIHPESTRHPQ